MTHSTDITVRRHVVVPVPPEEAFAAFTGRFGDVKPPEHNLLGAPVVESVFEPRVGGHVLDRAPDGSECRWARVLAWEPPHRVVFSWDIGPTWQLETDPDLTSEVEVRFVADGDRGTRVELEHRHIDRHGPGWESLHDAVGSEQGYPLWFSRLQALLSAH
ncbi:SRPBCC family protein [Jatrophihabitans fulvus]